MRNVLLTITVILLIAIMGCESNILKPIANDSSKQANIEDAKIALDDGHYQKAINALSSENSTDPEISGLLASAYMGAAGLDLTYLLQNVDSSKTDNFDIIASAINLNASSHISASAILYKATGASESSTTGSTIPIPLDKMIDIMKDLAKAEKYLNNSLALTANKNNEDLKVQLGICSALHFVLDIGYVVAKVEGLVTGTGATAIIHIPTSTAAYQSIFPKGTDLTDLAAKIDTELNSNADGKDLFNGNLSGLQNDLDYLYKAVLDVLKVNLPKENITQNFNEFMSEIVCPNSGTCDIPTAIHSMSAATLADFIQSKLL
jgi:hypothetical protein